MSDLRKHCINLHIPLSWVARHRRDKVAAVFISGQFSLTTRLFQTYCTFTASKLQAIFVVVLTGTEVVFFGNVEKSWETKYDRPLNYTEIKMIWHEQEL